MTQQLDSSFEANYVCLTTLSVLHMPWSAPYLLTCCLRTFLPIPRPAGGPFPMGRGFAIRDDPFLKLRGASIFLCAAPSPLNPLNPFTPAKPNQQENHI